MVPSSAVGGSTMFKIRSRAASTFALSGDPIVTIPTAPSSSTAISAPVSCWMVLMTLPFGPITSPILSIGIVMVTIFGAVSATESRAVDSTVFMLSKICRRASRACCNAEDKTSAGMPSIFVSNCNAVTASEVPATLKSMSPNASSAPRMSVRVVYLPSANTNPIAIPATGALIGTPASISDKLAEHTDAIEVEPFDDNTSLTKRIAYANSSWLGTTGNNARSAKAPCPISRRFGVPTRPTSPFAHGAML